MIETQKRNVAARIRCNSMIVDGGGLRKPVISSAQVLVMVC